MPGNQWYIIKSLRSSFLESFLLCPACLASLSLLLFPLSLECEWFVHTYLSSTFWELKEAHYVAEKLEAWNLLNLLYLWDVWFKIQYDWHQNDTELIIFDNFRSQMSYVMKERWVWQAKVIYLSPFARTSFAMYCFASKFPLRSFFGTSFLPFSLFHCWVSSTRRQSTESFA